jgi:gamma-glutamylcyclotransferase (GGCT)/AIG2-like uncharacterized protein YtfP
MPRSSFSVVDRCGGLEKVLLRLNDLRYAAEPSVEWTVAERMLDSLFGTSSRFAVYGTLAPGAPNHHVLEDLGGEWREGCVHGELRQRGWGAQQGYPAIRWKPGTDRIPVKLLVSEDLERHWRRLDEFEGPEYQRILVPVYSGDEVVAVANIYEARR